MSGVKGQCRERLFTSRLTDFCFCLAVLGWKRTEKFRTDMHANSGVHAQRTTAWTEEGLWAAAEGVLGVKRCRRADKKRTRAASPFTFLKKGIRFSFAKGDRTVFGLALGERGLAGSSLSSGSKPVASMSTAVHTDTRVSSHTGEHRQDYNSRQQTDEKLLRVHSERSSELWILP